MDKLALCSPEHRRIVKRAAGVEPLLSPPASPSTLHPNQLDGHDFLYIKLHGLPNDPHWYNAQGSVALDTDYLKGASLGGAVVYAPTCYLPESPMLEALLEVGASHVIGGHGKNWHWAEHLGGADLLGLYMRWMLELGASPKLALSIAKTRLKLKRPDKATRDTLDFRMWRGRA
jgi:hypothetical protein